MNMARTGWMRMAAVAMIGTAILGARAWGQGPAGVAPIPTISATGSAVESRDPDQAEVTFGVQSVGKTSEEAQDTLNRQMEKVIAAAKATKLEGLTTQTRGLSLYPEYEQERGNARSGPPRIVGYHASNSVTAKTSEVGKVGKIIDAAVAAGANNVMGISFSLKNDREARNTAIGSAAKDARSKAQAMADALGVQLGGLVRATTGDVQARPYMYALAGRESMAKMDAPTPVEPGEVDVSAQVTVEYSIIVPMEPKKP